MIAHDTRREGFSRSEQARAQPRRWRGSGERVATRRSVEAGVVEVADALLLVRGYRSVRLANELADAHLRRVRAVYNRHIVIPHASEEEAVRPHLAVSHDGGTDHAGLAHRLAADHHDPGEAAPAVVRGAGGLVVDVDDGRELHRSGGDGVVLHAGVLPLEGIDTVVHRAADDATRDDGHRLRRAGLVAVARGGEAAALAHAREDLRGGGLGRGGRPRLRDRSRRRGAGCSGFDAAEQSPCRRDLRRREVARLTACHRGEELSILRDLPLELGAGPPPCLGRFLAVAVELLRDRRPAGGRAEVDGDERGEAEVVLHGRFSFLRDLIPVGFSFLARRLVQST